MCGYLRCIKLLYCTQSFPVEKILAQENWSFLNGGRLLAGRELHLMGKTQPAGQIRVMFTARKLGAATQAVWLIQGNASQEHSAATASQHWLLKFICADVPVLIRLKPQFPSQINQRTTRGCGLAIILFISTYTFYQPPPWYWWMYATCTDGSGLYCVYDTNNPRTMRLIVRYSSSTSLEKKTINNPQYRHVFFL